MIATCTFALITIICFAFHRVASDRPTLSEDIRSLRLGCLHGSGPSDGEWSEFKRVFARLQEASDVERIEAWTSLAEPGRSDSSLPSFFVNVRRMMGHIIDGETVIDDMSEQHGDVKCLVLLGIYYDVPVTETHVQWTAQGRPSLDDLGYIQAMDPSDIVEIRNAIRHRIDQYSTNYKEREWSADGYR